jgi:oxepin-CoA hydrolase/3-oxo-5,6-dehydrosuberyl-CoA semialdehyde dehydrogenase
MALAKLTRENLPLFVNRISKLTADKKPQWGSLSATRMLLHLRVVVEMSLEERPFPDKSTWVSRNVVRRIAFHVMPSWPKGKIKVPDEITPESNATYEEERALFLRSLERFTNAAAAEPGRKTLHSLFGKLPLDYWTFMHARHFEHHFQQFGI